ncbi:MAG: hypothetical protein B6226_05075 [Candidatus Cloacimonetes bacterium 4572_65]|nr:MAG: hypothetical protein B6226_05075 [Candidatus Cloacimonetes bacterium 4572_65]
MGARKVKKSPDMNITSLIDILTILLLFLIKNASMDKDFVPESMELQNSLTEEKIAEDSNLFSLMVTYTGNDTGALAYKDMVTGEISTILRFDQLLKYDESKLVQLYTKRAAQIDKLIYKLCRNTPGKPLVVKVKADKEVPFKYIRVVNRLLSSIINNADGKSLIVTKLNITEFMLYFATEIVKDGDAGYDTLANEYGLGGL